MRLRPELNLSQVYKAVGSKTAPNPNAQLISARLPIAGPKAKAILEEVNKQVTNQGFEIAVKIAPPFAEPINREHKTNST